MFKVSILESTVCERDDCHKARNVDDVGIDWQVNLEDTSYLQTVSGIISKIMDPRGTTLDHYICDGCHTRGSCTKAYCVTYTSDFIIIQLCIFKFIDGISEKIIPTLKIDEEIFLWGNTMTLHALIYHEGEQANSGHYTSGVKVND